MNKQKKRFLSSQTFFYSVIVFTVLTLLMMFADNLMDYIGMGIFAVWILLTLSGIGLIIMTFREKIAGKLKIFQLITGFSAAGFLVFVVLHNALYALGTLTNHLPIIDAVIGFLEAVFFLAGVILSPLGILAGIIGTFILRKKQVK